MQIIIRVVVTRIWPNEGADVTFVFGMGLDVVFGCMAGPFVVIAVLAGLGGAVLGLEVAQGVTRLWKHEMSHCIVWTL